MKTAQWVTLAAASTLVVNVLKVSGDLRLPTAVTVAATAAVVGGAFALRWKLLKDKERGLDPDKLKTVAERKKLPFFSRFSESFFVCVIVFLGLIYPRLLMDLNPPPMESDLHEISGQVIKIQRHKTPHIMVTTISGKVVDLDLPSHIGYFGVMNWPENFENPGSDNWQNCTAVFKVADYRWSWIPLNKRIWGISCSPYAASYSTFVDIYRESRKIDLTDFFVYLIAALVLLTFIYREIGTRPKLLA